MPRHTIKNHKYDSHQSIDSSRQLSLFPLTECEFCNELAEPATSRFGNLYRDIVPSRIITAHNGFVVMPTLGQLFKGSLLILPKQHYETMAQLPKPNLDFLMELLVQLERQLQPLGTPVVFEHGAKCWTGRGCGIYHAHMHMVPVPDAISWEDALPASAQLVENLFEALQQLKDANQYLVFRDTDGKTALLQLEDFSPEKFPSQYFRQVLVRIPVKVKGHSSKNENSSWDNKNHHQF